MTKTDIFLKIFNVGGGLLSLSVGMKLQNVRALLGKSPNIVTVRDLRDGPAGTGGVKKILELLSRNWEI